MLPPNYFTLWGPGALYAELYVGLCRALVAPWLSPPRLAPAHGAPTYRPAQSRSPSELAAAEPPAAEPSAAQPPAEPACLLAEDPEPDSSGASIISFDRARARLSRRPQR
jgi:hypothetical protein